MSRVQTSLALSLAVIALACSSGERARGAPDGEIGGTVVFATLGEPTTLIPPLVRSVSEKQIVDQVFDVLAEIGPSMNTMGDAGWQPRLADSWTWSADSLSIAFHLNPDARWHDGHPVTASDVRFTFGLYKDPATLSADTKKLANVDSITVRDSLTAVAWFHDRSPEQFFQLAYTLLILPEHVLGAVERASLAQSSFARNPVGSGPFRFSRWESRAVVELVADTTYHRGRPLLDRALWTFSPDLPAAMLRVLSGDADFLEFVAPDALDQIAASATVKAVPYRSLNYGYLAFNLRDPSNPDRPHTLFGDKSLRIALTMALDRESMVRNALDSLGVVGAGPFTQEYPFARTPPPQIPYDTAGAARMLDSLGWRERDKDGVRRRDGVPLRFAILLPATSAPRRRMAVLIQAQLARVGAGVTLDFADPAAMGPAMFGGRFDALLQSLTSDPSPAGVAQNWGTVSPRSRGFNFSAYGSPVVDAVLDSAEAAADPARSQELYMRAYALIVADAPAVWLYENRPVAAVHMRLDPVMERADAWWRDLRFWSIPAADRIERDRIGLQQPGK